jgi:hypothetical protein
MAQYIDTDADENAKFAFLPVDEGTLGTPAKGWDALYTTAVEPPADNQGAVGTIANAFGDFFVYRINNTPYVPPPPSDIRVKTVIAPVQEALTIVENTDFFLYKLKESHPGNATDNARVRVGFSAQQINSYGNSAMGTQTEHKDLFAFTPSHPEDGCEPTMLADTLSVTSIGLAATKELSKTVRLLAKKVFKQSQQIDDLRLKVAYLLSLNGESPVTPCTSV